MKFIAKLLLSTFTLFFLTQCENENKSSVSGKIIYKLDYPHNKKNAILYPILPKQMELLLHHGQIKWSIRNANLQNITWVDCNQKQLSLYFQYADDAYKVQMAQTEVNAMLRQMEKYTLEFVDEETEILGFECKKALATSLTSPEKKITLWYTEDLGVDKPNWHTPFSLVPGILLRYEMTQFGLHMTFQAEKFEPLTDADMKDMMQVPAKGTLIDYASYNNKMTNLFSTFEQ
jgi:GLPGLI family protein